VTTFLAFFPSPSQGVWHLGPLPIRAYALFIIIGIIVALVIGDRRWVARGGEQGVIYDIALWAVPFGLIGGRLYHLMTDWKTYFGDDGAGFLAALKIWDGGLGIWGAVALGGVGAWIGCRQRGIPLPAFGDAIAPGIVLAQAIGRLGNYFNQELYGRATTAPWGLKIYERRDANGAIDYLNGVSTGHVDKIVQPTFLYELIWNVLVFVLLIYADRRFKLGHGRLFALYVAAYCVGRFWVELLRDDTATHIAGIRINSFTSMFVFIGAVVYIILAPKGRESPAALAGKPRKLKEAEPTAVQTKEEVPQKAEAVEGSALVEWAKELAGVAATSGVVAGVAVAEEDEDTDESAADGEAEPSDDDAGEPAEDVKEPDSAGAGEEEVAAAAKEEAEPAEAGAEDEAESEAEGGEGPEAESEAEGEEAEAAEAPEDEAEVPTEKVTAESVARVEPDDDEAAPTEDVAEEPEREAEPAEAEAEDEAEEAREAEEAAAAEEAAQPEDAEAPGGEGEEARAAEPGAEAEVPTEKVTAESVAGVEPGDEEAAPTEDVAEEPEGEAEPADAAAEDEAAEEPTEAEAARTEEVVDEAEAEEDAPGVEAGAPEPETEEGEEAEEVPKADSAAESSEERAEEVDAAGAEDEAVDAESGRAEEADEVKAPESPEVTFEKAADEATPPPAHDIAAAAGTQRARWSLPRFRNRRT
jgi:prolipoprotein diacylglyceryl transferase